MKYAYVNKRTSAANLEIIEAAVEILEEHKALGFDLTLRQLYYKFIGRHLFPDDWVDEKYNRAHNLSADTKNTVKNYKRLGSILDDARKAGLLDWSLMEDRARSLENSGSFFAGPRDLLDTFKSHLVVDLRLDQPNYVEIWVEKDAAVQVAERVARHFGMAYMANRGYLSTSQAHEAALRFRRANLQGKAAHVLYLGDHDPSGMDMSRDLAERMSGMYRVEAFALHRVLLNIDQVRHFNLPPDPAKSTDARHAGYVKRFGVESWELDALDIQVVQRLTTAAAQAVTDIPKLEARKRKQQDMRDVLGKVRNDLDRLMYNYGLDVPDDEPLPTEFPCSICEEDYAIEDLTPDGECESCAEYHHNFPPDAEEFVDDETDDEDTEE